MQSFGIFGLAYQKNAWLAQRQTTIAANIANVNTPGYRAKDIAAFEAVMGQAEGLAKTHAAHMGTSNESRPARSRASGGERLHSGNDVDVEKEFLKSGEVMRGFALNSQIIKSFHRMLLASAKS